MNLTIRPVSVLYGTQHRVDMWDQGFTNEAFEATCPRSRRRQLAAGEVIHGTHSDFLIFFYIKKNALLLFLKEEDITIIFEIYFAGTKFTKGCQ